MCDCNAEAVRRNEAVEAGLRALRERERVLAALKRTASSDRVPEGG